MARKNNRLEDLLRQLRGGKNNDDCEHEFVEIVDPEIVEPHVANATMMAEMEEQKGSLRERPDLAFVYRPGITAMEIFEQVCLRLQHTLGPEEHQWITLNLVSTLLKYVPPDKAEAVSKDLTRKFVV